MSDKNWLTEFNDAKEGLYACAAIAHKYSDALYTLGFLELSVKLERLGNAIVEDIESADGAVSRHINESLEWEQSNFYGGLSAVLEVVSRGT